MAGEDNSDLLQAADDIRAYEKGKAQGTIDDLSQKLSAAETKAESEKQRADAAEKKFADHMKEYAPAGHSTKPTDPEPPPPDPEPEGGLLGSSLGQPLPIVVPTLFVNRAYYQPGQMAKGQKRKFLDHSAIKQAYNQLGCRTFVVSFKDDDPAALTYWADSVPNDVRVYVTYFHEHDGNLRDGSLTLSKYQTGMGRVADMAEAYGFEFGPIHNGMVYDAAKTPKWGFYPSIWEKNSADMNRYTYWGVDGYCEKYEDPAVRYKPAFDYAESLDLPCVFGEIGAPKGSQQAPWAKKARTVMLEEAAVCCYWNNQVDASKPDWSLGADAAHEWFGVK